ncbi:caspase-2-like [Dreissena polymorpha]|uniref:Caspase-2 n=1 Tax=Dreissena polymorpha TaxID=45954 RepID=A0A9D4EKN5_DREPO|nr:caspase-2-like [Dreissena polymorpha]KAH3781396.1 hypothetical protein DPMN_159223 [Dreissena polymorpha]
MQQEHRNLLVKNRTLIIENMANPLDVTDMLYEKNIFTDAMKQDVEAQRTKIEQVRKILDLVPKRGPKAFEVFCHTMVETHNYSIAAALGVQGQGHVIAQPGADLPEEWPNEKAMSAPVIVEPCNVHSDLVRQNWHNPNVYPMRKAIRGKCLIISNKIFTKSEIDSEGVFRNVLRHRYGTERDVEKLTELFSQFHFEVIVKEDLQRDAMSRVLFQFSADKSLMDSDCFVCIICSHGTREGIYGTDGEIIPIEEVTSHFDGEHCPQLQEKPKLFFIQACQGEKYDRTEEDQGPDISKVVKDLKNIRLEDGANRTDAEGDRSPHTATATDAVGEMQPINTRTRVSIKQDILVACATHPDFVSFRNELYGSWFIQAVVYVFQKYAHKESLVEMLTMVNKVVTTGRTGTATQCSKYETSLTKKFLFFPGIIENAGS